MDKNKSNAVKSTAEDREIIRIDDKFNKITTGSSKLFYASLVALNILSLVLSMIYINNKQKLENANIVLENITWNTVVLLFVIFLCITLLEILPVYLKNYSRTKSKKFGIVFNSVAIGQFYEYSTVYGNGSRIMSTKYQTLKGMKYNQAIIINYSNKFFNNLSFVIYSFIFLFLSLFLWSNSVNIWLYILALLSFVIYLIYVILVLCFDIYKKSSINFISKVIRFLYKMKIIKDIEKTYGEFLDKMLIYTKGLKQNKWLTFTEIFSKIFVFFLKGVILYYALISMNIGDVSMLGELLFKCVIIELIFKIWPLQRGTLIFEFLFIVMFQNLFFEGYLYWGLIVFRFFDYFIYIIKYLLIIMFDKLISKKQSLSN